jgi:hypothetical protein
LPLSFGAREKAKEFLTVDGHKKPTITSKEKELIEE